MLGGPTDADVQGKYSTLLHVRQARQSTKAEHQEESIPVRGPCNFSLQDQARWYAEMFGWSTFPVCQKCPFLRWKHLQYRQPSRGEYEFQYRERTDRAPGGADGIGVAHGPASRHVCNRDFDRACDYEDWCSAFPNLSGLLPVIVTSRGYHVVFSCPAVQHVYRFPDGSGEFRAGAGCFSVIPPSAHPSGIVYSWLSGTPSCIPTVDDPVEYGLLTRELFTWLCRPPGSGTQFKPVKPKTRDRGDKNEDCVAPLLNKCYFSEQIERCIADTQPEGTGQRNRLIFRFVCRLHDTGEVDWGADGRYQRQQILTEWHRRARPVIGTKDWPTTQNDFCWAESCWRPPIAQASYRPLESLPDAFPTPDCAFSYDTDQRRELVRTCAYMQLLSGDRAFFLASRDAGQVLGIGPKHALKFLRRLQRDGILDMVELGRYRGRRRDGRLDTFATRWRYLGD